MSRFFAKGENHDTDLICDFHSELYPIGAGDKLDVVLASTLSNDGVVEKGTPSYDPHLKSALLDDYEYAMHGKVFKIEQDKLRMSAYISYGGLLMKLTGTSNSLAAIELDKNVYLLIKKRSV